MVPAGQRLVGYLQWLYWKLIWSAKGAFFSFLDAICAIKTSLKNAHLGCRAPGNSSFMCTRTYRMLPGGTGTGQEKAAR